MEHCSLDKIEKFEQLAKTELLTVCSFMLKAIHSSLKSLKRKIRVGENPPLLRSLVLRITPHGKFGDITSFINGMEAEQGC